MVSWPISFSEEDRGTQGQAQWQEKVIAYLDFKHKGHSVEYFGCRNYRVLCKTITSTRLANLKQWTQQAGGEWLMFWLQHKYRMSIGSRSNFLALSGR